MVPSNLTDLVLIQPGDTARSDKEAARNAIQKLGIPLESQFANFFLNYKVSSFGSNVSAEELLDVASPNEQISRATKFVREVWELPEKYICLSSVEAEGCYLYNKEDCAVYDFDLSEREYFIQGIAPKWNDFYSFMKWYLT